MRNQVSDDFVSSLLSQDDLLKSERFDAHRRELLERLKQAGRREEKARRWTITASALGALLVLTLLATATLPASQAWPDPLIYSVAIAVILTPVTLLILFGIYLFRYRAELGRIRREARQQTLMEVPRQLEELRKEIADLRQRLGKTGEKGFTLTEMLVTIGVLAILSSMLIVALAGAKSRARAITCTNNLRQQTQALAMYEGDNQFFPGSGDPVIGFDGPPWMIANSNAWTAKISYYLSDSKRIFLCPEYRAFYDRYRNLEQDSFGYNAGGSAQLNIRSSRLGLGYGSSNYVGLASITAPASMIALGDLQTPNSVWLNYINPDLNRPMGGLDSIIPTRHAGGANMSFVDGHLEWAKRPRWISATDVARARWNSDNQPHRESW